MRYKPKPDTRPRWHEDLKIYFSGRWYDAESYRKLCERYISLSSVKEPNYKNDPSYWWRRKK